MKVKFPDYNNCITNIPNSILKYFGYEEGRKTSSLLDSYLKKEYDNVVVLLLDGMGKCIIDGNLKVIWKRYIVLHFRRRQWRQRLLCLVE